MSSLIDDSLLDPTQTNQLDQFANLNLDLSTSHSLPYPATTHTAQTTIQSTPTTAQLTSFSDKLLLTISQHGKLAQWFSVPLGNENPSVGEGYLSLNGNGSGNGFGGDGYDDDEEGQGEAEGVQDDGVGGLLTPQNRFQARTILGGGGGEREIWGGLISRCVAGLIVQRAQANGKGVEAEGGGEGRVLIVGLGLVGVKFEGMGEEQRREVFLRILELVSRVL